MKELTLIHHLLYSIEWSRYFNIFYFTIIRFEKDKFYHPYFIGKETKILREAMKLG